MTPNRIAPLLGIAVFAYIAATGCATPPGGAASPAPSPTAVDVQASPSAAAEPSIVVAPAPPIASPSSEPATPVPVTMDSAEQAIDATAQVFRSQTPDQAVANAYGAGAGLVSRLAVAVMDLRTGALYGAGDIDAPYASASLVKAFIAVRLLADGQADDPAVRDQMWQMITFSDDDAGTSLYALAGGELLVPWIVERYGITGLAPTPDPGYWGLTRITAQGMVAFYAAVAADPEVAPWLLDAMAHAQPYGSDGFYQHFGIPSAATRWRVKQGWMCCLDGLTRMHSTGYVDDDRYAVALLIEGPRSLYGDQGAQVLTDVAHALLVGATVPAA